MTEPTDNPFLVANCRTCGKLFIRYSGFNCSECKAKEHAEMENVIGYIRSKPGAAIEEIASALDISGARVMLYADEGLFRRYGLPVNYPCRICNESIARGAICRRCNEKLNQQIVSLRESLWGDSYVKRPVEAAGNLRELKSGGSGSVTELFSDSSITSRRARDKKSRRSTGSGGYSR